MSRKIGRITGFSARQLVTLAGIVLVAGIVSPVAARAAASLVAVSDGTGPSQAAVGGSALLGQTVAGVAPGGTALEGSR